MLHTLDLELFRQTALEAHPFPYMVIPGAVKKEALKAIHADYPETKGPGSFPISFLRYGEGFQALVRDLESKEFRSAVENKFGIDLTGRPSMITARGQARLRDGQIHTDTESKLITVLIYMNPEWESDGGRLRLLRSRDSLEDIITEVPPVEGTMIIFKVSPNSWHGHKPVEGPRRVVQFNYVTSKGVVWREQARHAISALIKRFQPVTEKV